MHDAEMAYFRSALSKESPVTFDLIRSTVENSPFTSLDDEARESIARELESDFDITQLVGAAISGEDHVPWLNGRKPDIDFYYWTRLKNFYMQTGALPPNVINILDQVTDEVLDYCGNPAAPELRWKKRGMVLGHVQSGKTTNYSALISKAADAGYEIIILLAGITNSLRSQTQERIDDTFIGIRSVFQPGAQLPLPIKRYAPGHRTPLYGTSLDQDFSSANAGHWGVSLAAIKEPMIFVTKKNKSVLEGLRDWLRQQNPGDLIDHPLLLIDDEADNASINTSGNPNRVTAINGCIRDILKLFSKSSYVGYTATPFANIFIDPDTEDDMLEDDLFPTNFIKALDPPENYVGATRIFAEKEDGGDLRDLMIERVVDYSDILPLKHKIHHEFDILPPTLEKATRVFVLTRAVRILRGDTKQHSSMMINVSRFNIIQEKVGNLVYEYLEKIVNSITTNAGLGSRGLRDPLLQTLSEDFNSEFCTGEKTIEENWEDVQGVLSEAVRPIRVQTVNMRGGILDYSSHKDEGLHVIAIGGLALSRGLTLEGLTVTYILRNASASDTLMQMARWFGYRSNYEELCRLYIPDSSVEHYDFVNVASEELRTEIKRMERLRMTPRDFGLRVRHSPAIIRITAANKMRAAQKLTIAADYSGRHVEGYRLINSADIFSKNRLIVDDFLSALEGPEISAKSFQWRGVRGARILELLGNYDFSPRHPDLGEIEAGHSLLGDYVAQRIGGELAEWEVILPFNISENAKDGFSLNFENVNLRRREAGCVEAGDYKVTRKNRMSSPGDEKLGYPDEVAKQIKEDAEIGGRRVETELHLSRSKPLMLVHMFNAKLSEAEAEPDQSPQPNDAKLAVAEDERIASLSFIMPGTKVTTVGRSYAVNKVYMTQLELFRREDDDDNERQDDQ